jgi:hypothetical protein
MLFYRRHGNKPEWTGEELFVEIIIFLSIDRQGKK